ncbi:MAG TPA: hypothetical protein VHM88_24425 [Candidatus Acidoferrales bacterium]|jgi:hypothetical protein|nr:hypothetical protein [Candidatus Acidoferrales bacterium]
MLSAGQIKREPSISVGVAGLAILLAVYFALGHFPSAWDAWCGWLAGGLTPTVALPPNPYTLGGIIRFP